MSERITIVEAQPVEVIDMGAHWVVYEGDEYRCQTTDERIARLAADGLRFRQEHPEAREGRKEESK